MSIFQKFTLRSLKANKMRTIVTIVGIILSTALLTAVTTAVSSLQNYILEVEIQASGSWHSSVFGLKYDEVPNLLAREEVDRKAVLAQIEYAKLDTVQRERTPYLYIGGFSGEFAELLTVRMTEGRLPDNSSELIVPASMAERSGIKYEVGQSIELETGLRKNRETGDTMWQDWLVEPREENEVFASNGKKTYQIVGIYESARFGDWGAEMYAPGYPALTKMDDAVVADGAMVYMTLKDPDGINAFQEKLDKEYGERESVGINTNRGYLRYSGHGMGGSLVAVLAGLMAILIGIIMFGSISLIYNSFAISVNERKKQYGLLSSIGATRKQMKRSVIFEAVILSLVGVPLGVLVGIGGMSVTFYCLRDTFASFLSYDISGSYIHMSAAMWSVVLASGVGFVTVLISAYLPVKKALKVNTIDAIRQTTDIMVKPNKLKTSWLTQKLFGLEGVLASKNYKRNKKKYRATVFSLFISVVLFISASSFCGYLSTSLDEMMNKFDYDISYSDSELAADGKKAEELFGKLKQVDGVTESSFHYSCWNAKLNLPVKYISENMYKNITVNNEPKPTDASALEEKMDIYGIVVGFVEHGEYEAYLKANNLDVKRYMDTESPVPLVFDKDVMNWSVAEERYEFVRMFEGVPRDVELSFEYYPTSEEESDEEEDTVTADERDVVVAGKQIITIDEIRNEKLPGFDGEQYSNTLIVYPLGAMKKILPDEVRKQEGALECVMTFHAGQPGKVSDQMQEIRDENGAGGYLNNIAEEIKASRALMMVLKVFSYGFIVLISLIAVANVFNTISTNVFLRRREFAMLRSVGMTWKSFHRMANFECLLYGVKGLMYGLPVAIGITVLIWHVLNKEVVIDFYIPWYSIAIAVGSVFLVVFATMLYSTSKIRKDNVVETLKNENY